MTLKKLRKAKKITQAECAKFLEIPLRTYQNYENDPSKCDSIKYQYMLDKLEGYGIIGENIGILTTSQIKDICAKVLGELDVEYCFLFGSYAKGKATESSDVDLLISTPLSGMAFFDMAEALREALNKKVDVLNLAQLKDNPDLINEILKDGVKIYG